MNAEETISSSGMSQETLHSRPPSGRLIPPIYFDAILKSIQQEAGSYSLQMLLENAGMAEFSQSLAETRRTVRASDISRLNRAVRRYYGEGSRGLLTRAGRGAWNMMLPALGVGDRLRISLWRFTSLDGRRFRVLRLMENFLGLARAQLSLHPAEQGLILVDRTSDPTAELSEEGIVCWFTAGLIQAAFAWATGSEHFVEEIICRAAGGDACKFRIRGQR